MEEHIIPVGLSTTQDGVGLDIYDQTSTSSPVPVDSRVFIESTRAGLSGF